MTINTQSKSVIDLYNEIKKEKRSDVEALSMSFGKKFQSGNLSFDDVISTINQASKNQMWFNNFKKELGKKFKVDDLKRFSDKEIEETQKNFKFTNMEHTVRDITDKTQIGDVMQTNILPVIGSLLYDSPLLSRVDRIRSPRNHELPEKETKLQRVGTTNEIGGATKRKIVNRETEKLDPNNKVSILVEVSESSKNAPDLDYLLRIILGDLVYANQTSVEEQALLGDDTGTNFRGLLSTVGSGATEKGAITVNVAGGENAYDKLWTLYKNRNKNNRRRTGPDVFLMTEKTLDIIIDSKLKDDNYLTWVRDLIVGDSNVIVLPRGRVEVVLVNEEFMDDGDVLLGPINEYKLVVSNDFEVSDDMGILNFANDIITYKCKFLGDGGFRKSFTKKIDGTTPNLEENLWRRANIL